MKNTAATLVAITFAALLAGCGKPALPSLEAPDPAAMAPEVSAPDAPEAPSLEAPAAPEAPEAPAAPGT